MEELGDRSYIVETAAGARYRLSRYHQRKTKDSAPVLDQDENIHVPENQDDLRENEATALQRQSLTPTTDAETSSSDQKEVETR